MNMFKEDNGNWSFARVRGFVTLLCGIGLAFYLGYHGKLDRWSVALILGWTVSEAILKTAQKRFEK
jgi:hypothetical protein